MNNGFKKIIAISLILVFVGIALLGGAIIASKGDFKTISNAFQNFGLFIGESNSIENTKTFNMDSKLENIEMAFVNSNISVSKSLDGKVHVSYEKRKNHTYEEVTTGNQLLVKEKANWFFNPTLSRTEVSISIPEESSITKIKLSVVSGSFKVVNVAANSLDLKAVDASSTITGTKTNTLFFETTNGDLNIQDSSASSLKYNNVNGSANLSKTTFSDIVMNTVNGTATLSLLGKKDDYKVYLEVVNGSLEFNNDKFKGNTTLNGNNPKNSITYKGVNANLILKTVE